MKLTKRESILLTVLAFVLLNVVVLGYVVLPLIPANQQLKAEADELQFDLNMKLLLIQSSMQLQDKNDDLKKDLDQLQTRFLPELMPEGVDEYLDDNITQLSTDWRSVGIGSYANAQIVNEIKTTTLSYINKAEVQIQLKTSEAVTMEIMKMFQESSNFIGIKDIQVSGGLSTFTIEFYEFVRDEVK